MYVQPKYWKYTKTQYKSYIQTLTSLKYDNNIIINNNNNKKIRMRICKFKTYYFKNNKL